MFQLAAAHSPQGTEGWGITLQSIQLHGFRFTNDQSLLKVNVIQQMTKGEMNQPYRRLHGV